MRRKSPCKYVETEQFTYSALQILAAGQLSDGKPMPISTFLRGLWFCSCAICSLIPLVFDGSIVSDVRDQLQSQVC